MKSKARKKARKKGAKKRREKKARKKGAKKGARREEKARGAKKRREARRLDYLHCSMLSTILFNIVTPDCRLIQAQPLVKLSGLNITEQYC